MARHQAPTADGTEKTVQSTPLAHQVSNNFQAPDTVAGNHMRIIVGGCLKSLFLDNDLAGQVVARAGLIVASEVIGANFPPERPGQFEFDPGGSIWHDNNNPGAKAHAGIGNSRGEIAG